MAERSLYILSLRAILLALGGVLLLGGVGGAITSWWVVGALLRDVPKRPDVAERIERVESAGGVKFSEVLERFRGNVIGVLGSGGEIVQTGVVLTADGIAVTPSGRDSLSSPRVVLADGTETPAALLREYPEKGLTYYRLSGKFSAPQFANDVPLTPGTEGVLLRQSRSTSLGAARRASVEYVAPPPRAVQEVLLGSEKVGVLEKAPDASYHGAPFVSGDGRLLGLVNVSREGGYVLPAADVNLLLEDVLRHPTGGAVSVLGGIRGVWVSGEEAKRVAPSSPLAFVVENVAARSPSGSAGLKTQDVIVGADDKVFPAAGSLWAILLEGTRAQKPVTLNVRRKGETISVVFTP